MSRSNDRQCAKNAACASDGAGVPRSASQGSRSPRDGWDQPPRAHGYAPRGSDDGRLDLLYEPVYGLNAVDSVVLLNPDAMSADVQLARL